MKRQVSALTVICRVGQAALTLSLLGFIHQSTTNAGLLSLSYGCTFDGGTFAAPLFFESDGSTLLDSNDLMVVGTLSTIPTGTTLTNWLSAFTPLSGAGFEEIIFPSGVGAGYQTGAIYNFDTDAPNPNVIGQSLYLMVLAGIDGGVSYANASTADGFAVVRSSGWGAIPAGGAVTPEAYSATAVTFDTILVGNPFTHTLNSGGQGISAVPEPSNLLVLVGLGFAGLLRVRVRRSSKRG